MDVNSYIGEKTDVFLEDALTRAKGDETLRVIMSLVESKVEESSLPELKPSQFPSRIAYRQALIE